MNELSGPWRFHTGDNPAWANPTFDDSHWSLLTASKPWSEQGYQGYTGMGWYRLHVVVPAQHEPLAFYLPNVDESCQVFANGQLIGQVGGLPPHPRLVIQSRTLFPISDKVLVPGQPLLIAVRVWHSPIFAGVAGGGVYPAPSIGSKSTIEEWNRLQSGAMSWQNAGYIVEFYGNFLTALAGLGLFVMRRGEKEYFWFGISQLVWAIYGAIGFIVAFRSTGYYSYFLINTSVYGVATLFQIEFLVAFLRQRRSPIYWATVACALLSTAANLHSAYVGETSYGFLYAIAAVGTLSGELALLVVGSVQKNLDAPFLLLPYSIMLFVGILSARFRFPYLATENLGQFLYATIRWPFVINAFQLAGAFEMFSVLVVLVRRYARSRRDEERLEAELEAARIVQKVLIPEDIPPIAGFQVHTVYKPAGQVGGDFFQVIPLETGGALIVIGDVSGKGLPAAMTVSLLVGTFRTLAHYTSSPREILSAMNQRMLARSKDGFTTCLVLRLDPDGKMTIANAGHIAPYVGSHEVQVVNGLPLGLTSGTSYAEVEVSLAPEEHLTLLTDGVVEARSHNGELFGFERTAAISDESAEKIAEAAQAFGQEDDITVLSLTRRDSDEFEKAFQKPPALSPVPA